MPGKYDGHRKSNQPVRHAGVGPDSFVTCIMKPISAAGEDHQRNAQRQSSHALPLVGPALRNMRNKKPA